MSSQGSRRPFFILNLGICIWLFSGTLFLSEAYVLKGEHVLQLMIEKNRLPKRLGVSQTVSFFDPEVDFMAADYEERVLYHIPGAFRSDIKAPNFQRVHVVADDRAITILDGRLVSESEFWADHYKDLFCYPERWQLVEKLQELGINFSVSSLGRYQGIICYVIGAHYPDETVPQIWVDKETFRPLRWIVEVSAGQEGLRQKEIRYLDWQSHFRSWYPSRIDFVDNGQPVRRVSVRQVETNPSFSADLFNVDRLEQMSRPRMYEERRPEVGEDVSHQIEEFKKIYR